MNNAPFCSTADESRIFSGKLVYSEHSRIPTTERENSSNESYCVLLLKAIITRMGLNELRGVWRTVSASKAIPDQSHDRRLGAAKGIDKNNNNKSRRKS